jgi:hypothetical protein
LTLLTNIPLLPEEGSHSVAAGVVGGHLWL